MYQLIDFCACARAWFACRTEIPEQPRQGEVCVCCVCLCVMAVDDSLVYVGVQVSGSTSCPTTTIRIEGGAGDHEDMPALSHG